MPERCEHCGAPDVNDLVGAGEIADRLGTKKNVVVNWAGRYGDFPAPIISHLKMGRIWSWREVNAWHSNRHTTTT
jgi:hypothetical protein